MSDYKIIKRTEVDINGITINEHYEALDPKGNVFQKCNSFEEVKKIIEKRKLEDDLIKLKSKHTTDKLK